MLATEPVSDVSAWLSFLVMAGIYVGIGGLVEIACIRFAPEWFYGKLPDGKWVRYQDKPPPVLALFVWPGYVLALIGHGFTKVGERTLNPPVTKETGMSVMLIQAHKEIDDTLQYRK